MKVPLYKLFCFADSWDKVLMAVGTIGAIGNGLTQPLMALIFGELIEAFGKSQVNDTASIASKVSLKYVYLALGCGTAAFLQVACWVITGERQAARIRSLYLKTILQQEIAYFDQEVSSGEVVGRMSGDTIIIQDAMGEKVGMFVQVAATFLGGFIIAFAKGWLLTLILLSSIPLLGICGGIMLSYVSKKASRAQNAYGNAAAVVQQTIGSIRTVASFTGENQAVANYKKFLMESYKSGITEGFYFGLGLGSFFFIMLCTFALAVWFGAKMILHKGYTGGEVFTVLIAVIIGSTSLSHVSPSMAAFSSAQAAAFKMFETINRKPSIDAYDTSGIILNDIHGDIELRNVCFSYPGRPGEQILNDFCLLIPSGTSTALVGQSGSGKSTIISLIERFYDPQAGEVILDGIDLRECQLKWIRSKIGLVSQEPVLFTASIRDNIAYGKDGATLDEIIAAARLANASDFINKLPQGLDTKVGESGIQLSGGQKQRVAIARAIIKDPRILLLDEATSALDAHSERVVQEALEKVTINRTTVIVAHRLSTIRNADMIAVLHQGKLVEKGTPLELLKDHKGVYSNLIRSQEVNADAELCVDKKHNADTAMNIGRELCQRTSLLHTLSRGSHGDRNNTGHSISILGTEQFDSNVIYPETSKNILEIPIHRLAYLNKPELPVLAVGTVFTIMTSAVLPVFGLILSSVVDSFYEMPHKLKKDSEFWALVLVVLGAASFIAYSARTHLFGIAGNKLVRRIRLMCFQKVVNMEVGWFDKPDNSSGAIGARLSTDAAVVRGLVGDTLALLVEKAFSVVIGLSIAFEASWQLTLIILVMLLLIVLNGYVQVKYTKGLDGDAKVMYGEASQVANDAVGNIRTVASFCTQEKTIVTYKKKCEGPVANRIRQGLINGIGFGVSVCFMYLAYATSFYAGARLVQGGKITTSDVFRVYYSLSMVAIAISGSSSLALDSNKAKSAATSIFAILDGKSKIDPRDDSGMTLENVSGEIKLNNVNFKYPNRPDTQILQNLSLTIHSDKIVALVGESGSGKSTVISLLQRFYDPDSGQITLDGVEIKKFQVKWLRQQMGLVSQEPILFNETIRANISYGKEGSATEGEIIAAAKFANAHKFISGLQQGYDTIVGERGIQLSGGQKQRVAIARAIVKNPRILLLDEATSALDIESEKIVQEALDRVMKSRTTVVVAHRLSTIRGADEIAVLKNGRIVEKGNHNALINIKDGLYSSLVKLHSDSFILINS